MLNLDTIPSDLVTARGQYATVRAELEDATKELQVLTGLVASRSAQILKDVQDGKDVSALLAEVRGAISKIECVSSYIVSLHAQKESLKPLAWGK
ncbi:hypothetical protein [Cupriavidus gilardii]|uniref:hypothetical protein n=1 Tax=Cupriavidus gilardii TaxID=82541 RepID=UPI002B2E28B1|nr:hypothetical protein QWJ31_19695 [Cupriavidus gilardii]